MAYAKRQAAVVRASTARTTDAAKSTVLTRAHRHELTKILRAPFANAKTTPQTVDRRDWLSGGGFYLRRRRWVENAKRGIFTPRG